MRLTRSSVEIEFFLYFYSCKPNCTKTINRTKIDCAVKINNLSSLLADCALWIVSNHFTVTVMLQPTVRFGCPYHALIHSISEHPTNI